jgi:hypothetical protein
MQTSLNVNSTTAGQDESWDPSTYNMSLNMTATTGSLNAMGAITGGSSYVNGTYLNVPLTGGTGVGAIATITVAAGAVSAVTITNPGAGYTAADSLSASNTNLGGAGSGFAIPATSINAYTASVAVPTGYSVVNMVGSVNYAVNFNGSKAVFPSTNVINGTASELNPTIRSLQSISQLSIATGVVGVVVLSFYTIQ